MHFLLHLGGSNSKTTHLCDIIYVFEEIGVNVTDSGYNEATCISPKWVIPEKPTQPRRMASPPPSPGFRRALDPSSHLDFLNFFWQHCIEFKVNGKHLSSEDHFCNLIK